MCWVFIAAHRLSLVSASWGYPLVKVHRLLIAVPSLAAEHGLQACRLSSRSTRALLIHGMWNLPRPGIEPMSPALAGGFFITEPLVVKVKSLSRVRLFATPWTVAYQAPPSMGFSRQEYWSELPFPSPLNTSS